MSVDCSWLFCRAALLNALAAGHWQARLPAVTAAAAAEGRMSGRCGSSSSSHRATSPSLQQCCCCCCVYCWRLYYLLIAAAGARCLCGADVDVTSPISITDNRGRIRNNWQQNLPFWSSAPIVVASATAVHATNTVTVAVLGSFILKSPLAFQKPGTKAGKLVNRSTGRRTQIGARTKSDSLKPEVTASVWIISDGKQYRKADSSQPSFVQVSRTRCNHLDLKISVAS